MTIKTRKKDDKLPQEVGSINFLNPKSPKLFGRKLKEWLKAKGIVK